MSNGEPFIERLLLAIPELKPVYAEHLADNDVLLPHVFMGDVTRFIVAELDQTRDADVVSRLLHYLESELNAGNADAIELIRASFVENLMGEEAAINKLRPLMGSALLREVESICNPK